MPALAHQILQAEYDGNPTRLYEMLSLGTSSITSRDATTGNPGGPGGLGKHLKSSLAIHALNVKTQLCKVDLKGINIKATWELSLLFRNGNLNTKPTFSANSSFKEIICLSMIIRQETTKEIMDIQENAYQRLLFDFYGSNPDYMDLRLNPGTNSVETVRDRIKQLYDAFKDKKRAIIQEASQAHFRSWHTNSTENGSNEFSQQFPTTTITYHDDSEISLSSRAPSYSPHSNTADAQEEKAQVEALHEASIQASAYHQTCQQVDDFITHMQFLTTPIIEPPPLYSPTPSIHVKKTAYRSNFTITVYSLALEELQLLISQMIEVQENSESEEKRFTLPRTETGLWKFFHGKLGNTTTWELMGIHAQQAMLNKLDKKFRGANSEDKPLATPLKTKIQPVLYNNCKGLFEASFARPPLFPLFSRAKNTVLDLFTNRFTPDYSKLRNR